MLVAALPPLYPPHSRVGAWLATHEFLAGMVRAGHHVRVLPVMSSQTKPYTLDGVYVVPSTRREDLVRDADVVICHLPAPGSRDALAGLAVTRPVVRFAHGIHNDLRVAGTSSLLVANSEFTAGLLSTVKAPTVVCHPPVDPSRFVARPAGDRILLVNLSPAKGGELFWQLARALPDLRFLGVRGGYGAQVIRSSRNVEILNPTRDMQAVYERASIVLMPSQHETWGMVAVEAMASGRPVLASRAEGLRESLGRAGTFVETFELRKWAEGIRYLLEPAVYAAAVDAGLRRVKDLDPQKSIDRFVRAVEEVAR